MATKRARRVAQSPCAVRRHAPAGAAAVVVEAHFETVGRQQVAGLLGPFDDADAGLQRHSRPSSSSSDGAREAIEIEVRHRHARRRVALHQREGRARDLLVLVAGERMDDGAGERRLAGAELAAQREEIAAARDERQVLAEADKLGLADIVDGVGNGDCQHALFIFKRRCRWPIADPQGHLGAAPPGVLYQAGRSREGAQ